MIPSLDGIICISLKLKLCILCCHIKLTDDMLLSKTHDIKLNILHHRKYANMYAYGNYWSKMMTNNNKT